jgi:hypothetical protein
MAGCIAFAEVGEEQN